MEIGCASYSFKNKDLSHILSWLRANNIEKIDIGAPVFALEDQSTWERITTSCRNYDVKPCILTVNYDVLQRLPLEPGELFNLGLLIRAVDAAVYLGTYRLGLVVNQIPDGLTKEETFSGLVNSLNKVAGYCQDQGVEIMVEIHVRGPITTLNEAIRLKEETVSPQIGYILDTSLLAYQGIDFAETCWRLRDRPLNVHIRDLTTHDFFGIPGRGPVDFEAVLKILQKVGYAHPLIIELFKTEENYQLSIEDAVKEAKSFLEETWQQLGFPGRFKTRLR